MTLLDASGLVAFLLDEPAAPRVEQLLEEGGARIASVNLAEAIDVLVRVFGNDLEEVEDRLVPLLVDKLDVLAVDEPAARRGAEIRINYYDAKDLPLSMGDCLLLGIALTLSETVATSDGPVAQVARDEGVDLIPLRDSFGRRP